MLLNSKNHNGVALTLAIVMIFVIIILGIIALNLAFNYRKLSDSVSAAHVQAYFRAQAGVVDARWRIRNNIGGDFTVAATTLGPYPLDIDGDGVNDVTVTITAANAQGLRTISSQGRQ